MDAIEILLKEYETLRQEILTAMGSRNTILSFGLATVGAIFTASIATQFGDSPSPFSSTILAVVIPIVCVFVLFMWLGEYQRMQRAGRFLVGLEKRINDEAKKELLSWESKHEHMKYPYNTTAMLIILLSIASHVIGLITFGIIPTLLWIFLIVGVAVQIAIYFFAVFNISKLSR